MHPFQLLEMYNYSTLKDLFGREGVRSLRKMRREIEVQLRAKYGECDGCGKVKQPIAFVPEDHVPIRSECLK